jgi:hypothetical protein
MRRDRAGDDEVSAAGRLGSVAGPAGLPAIGRVPVLVSSEPKPPP